LASTLSPLVGDLNSIEVELASLFLDPNNPRFVGPNWSYVPDSEIDSQAAQEAARLKLLREFGADKLRMNMEANGFLPIDRVIVRQFGEGKYVVLEGNRRICAAKLLVEDIANGLEVSAEVQGSLSVIPCLEYVGADSDAAWIFQGLRHITGISDWPAFNKAKLLVEQMEREALNLTEVGKRFGLTPHGAGQWVRGYYAFKQAAEQSDFISEVDERAYPYFQELFSRSSAAVREWMEWDEKELCFKNSIKFNEFVSWLYARPADVGEESDVFGDWERRALRRRDDIRQVAFLLTEDPEAFEQFRREHDIERAYSVAVSRKYEREAKGKSDPTRDVFQALAQCTKELQNVPFRLLKDPELRDKLFGALDELENAIASIRD
jgi:hypothetical protein